MKLIDTATKAWRELAEDSSTSIPAINYWLRDNVGSLNNLIHTDYTINVSNGQISPELGYNEEVIFKKMFHIHFWDLKIRSVLGAASTDSVIEVTSNGATVRRLNRNELSKTYLSAKKMAVDELDVLIAGYLSSLARPLAVHGDDTETD